MRIFDYFTLFIAIAISAVAAYYSIVGLTAIFAAAFWPVVIMGGVLESGKLTGAVWLKLYWKQANWWIKLYLVPAVAVLMLITSIGIFGFLSKAHVEQTAAATEGTAKIERIVSEIARQNDLIARSEAKIKAAETKGTSSDTNIQEQIDREQERIAGVNLRIQPAIAEQNSIISKEEARLGGSVTIYEDQIKTIDENLTKLDQYLTAGDIKMAQGLVGSPVDGKLGNKTSVLIAQYRASNIAKKDKLAQKVNDQKAKLISPVIDTAREEIKRIRTVAEAEIANSNELIAKFRAKIGLAEQSVDVSAIVAVEYPKIEAANTKITQLTEEKYALETEGRKLEAEVGPIKFVAELLYGATDKSLLEQAVSWMILLLVAVFDPLAIILTMAAITSLAIRSRESDKAIVTASSPEIQEVVEEVAVEEDAVEEDAVEEDAVEETEDTDQKKKLTEIPKPEIVYVDRIVEVPVEKIVERIVEKIVEVPDQDSNSETVQELANEVQRLLAEIEDKDNELKFRTRSDNIKESIAASADFDLGEIGTTSFGTAWPNNPARGDLFLKVDTKPNILYKWNNKKWIQVDKARIDDTLAYDPTYIDYLIQQVRKGFQDYDDLSDMQQRQIIARVRDKGQSPG